MVTMEPVTPVAAVRWLSLDATGSGTEAAVPLLPPLPGDDVAVKTLVDVPLLPPLAAGDVAVTTPFVSSTDPSRLRLGLGLGF